MSCDALIAKTVAAIRDEGVLEHAHTDRTSEIILGEPEQLSSFGFGRN